MMPSNYPQQLSYPPQQLPDISPRMLPESPSPLLTSMRGGPPTPTVAPVRRRRLSSKSISKKELEQRQKENKTAHSVIEKRRRIKMNREFEALKYLVPACRHHITQQGTGPSANAARESMFKLTVLQSTVDYISYLHSIVDSLNTKIQDIDPSWEYDTDAFAKIKVPREEYRDVDTEFDFGALFSGNRVSPVPAFTQLPQASLNYTTTTETHEEAHHVDSATKALLMLNNASSGRTSSSGLEWASSATLVQQQPLSVGNLLNN